MEKSVNKINEGNPQTEPTGHRSDLGKQLRRAREASGLSVQSVSASLHLTPKIVIALEEGDFAQFQPVYVKGYLRNYGRLLNLPVEHLINSYDRIAQPAQAPLQMAMQNSKTSKSNLVLVLLFAVIVLTALGLIARKVMFPSVETPDPQSGADASHLPLSPMPSGDVNTIENATKPSDELSGIEGIIEQSGRVSGQPDAEVLTNKTQPSVTALAYPFVGPPKPVPGDSQHGKPTNASPPAILENPTQVRQPDNQGADTIAVHLSARAWVGIRDHAGRRLVYKRLPAGTELSFTGQAPFLVVLGNSSATKIQLNGKPYQLPKSKAGATARLTVGQNERPGG